MTGIFESFYIGIPYGFVIAFVAYFLSYPVHIVSRMFGADSDI